MKIGLDIMGGDFAPAEAIQGVRQFFETWPDSPAHLVLIGSVEVAGEFLTNLEPFKGRFTVVDAPDIVGMHDHPTQVLKEKPRSSIALGFGMLMQKKIDAFIGAGNTGAMMVGAMYTVKTVDGVLRPTIASPVPREDGTFNLMLDVGANADCKPEHLVQFAQLGALYSELVMGVDKPKVGLLNLGEEEGKGNLLVKATYPLLKEHPEIDFAGNIEGRDIFEDKCNVIVCEGFVGNVVLKSAESIHTIFAKKRGFQDPFLEHFNYEMYGGTPILGVNAPVVIGHGISGALAFSNMIDVASKIVKSGLTEAIQNRFATAKAS